MHTLATTILTVIFFTSLAVTYLATFMLGYLRAQKEVICHFKEALDEQKWDADTLWEKFEKQPMSVVQLFRKK